MDLELADKACLVAGGSRGIGRAIALGLAAEGARVAVVARGAEGLADVASALAIRGGGARCRRSAASTSSSRTSASRSRAPATRWTRPTSRSRST